MMNVRSYKFAAWLIAAPLVTSACGSAANEIGEDPLAAQVQDWTVGSWSVESSQLAPGAFTTSRYSLNLPVCRARFDGGWHPGKYFEGVCMYEWGGQKQVGTTFQTLLNNGRMSWVRMTGTVCNAAGCFNQVQPTPQNAIDGGPAGWAANNVTLGVCMAQMGGQYHPGKWFKNQCNIEYGGRGWALQPAQYDAWVAVSN